MTWDYRSPEMIHRRVRLRQCMFATGIAIFIFFSVSLLFKLLSDPCHGWEHRNFLCQNYRLGEITGKLCPQLCIRNEITFSDCLREETHFSVFLWRQWELKVVKDHVRKPLPGKPRLPAFDKPEKGTSMAQFRDMVTTFIDSKLGAGDHSGLIDRIMNTADVDSDEKVTLAEAKTIWSLLQLNDFFIAFIFHDVDHIPKIRGFCGDMFATDYYYNKYLFKKDALPLLQSVFPRYYTWGFPEWNNRAKVMLGLLEFTMEAYQHSNDGAFHMCRINELAIGYTSKYDVRLTELDHIIPDAEIQAYLNDKSCVTNNDCSYSRQCMAVCDSDSKKCSPHKVRPNLYHICEIMREYIQDDAPSNINKELRQLLQRCSDLNVASSEVEHSLLLNDLKSTIWQEISYDKSS